ncbi:MAG: endonuclease III [Planctomycetaceae bacterium]|jgi:endonuclease-3|nr:endonuclease III [Planctomycetaceae bacterium]
MSSLKSCKSPVKKIKIQDSKNQNNKVQEVKKRFAERLLFKLRESFPDADCSLCFRSPFELLVATILSAQCTDVQVNKVTTILFQKYNKPEDFAGLSPEELEGLIRSTGFYRNKAKNIKAAANEIIKRFNGNIPQTMDELITLSGVGRKTANVVLGNGFGINAGFVVDTHVFRLSHRLGLSAGKLPDVVERDLMEVFPQHEWKFLSHALIQLGRNNCKSRKPECQTCPLNSLCPQYKNLQ